MNRKNSVVAKYIKLLILKFLRNLPVSLYIKLAQSLPSQKLKNRFLNDIATVYDRQDHIYFKKFDFKKINNDEDLLSICFSLARNHNVGTAVSILEHVNLKNLTTIRMFELASCHIIASIDLKLPLYKKILDEFLSRDSQQQALGKIIRNLCDIGAFEKAEKILDIHAPPRIASDEWLPSSVAICAESQNIEQTERIIRNACLTNKWQEVLAAFASRNDLLIDKCCEKLFGHYFAGDSFKAELLKFRQISHENVNDKRPDRFYTIFDFRVFPYSLGEIFYQMQAVECMMFEKTRKKIEVIIFAPAIQRNDQATNTYNYFQKILDLIRFMEFFGHICAIKCFDDESEYDNYVAGIGYFSQQIPKRGQGYKQNTSLINSHFFQMGNIPRITIRRKLEDDVRRFIREHAKERLSVCVHIRANQVHREKERNINIVEMSKLCSQLLSSFNDIHLFIISGVAELSVLKHEQSFVDERITLVKDYHSTSAFDFALAATCAVFLGGPSGPSVPVIYGTSPYILFNYRLHTSFHFKNVTVDSGYAHSTKDQIILWGKENSENIFEAFEKIYSEFDRGPYWQKISNADGAKNTSNFQELR